MSLDRRKSGRKKGSRVAPRGATVHTRKAAAPTHPEVLIGWEEYVDLPDWKISDLRAKVDTGARSSALHVENVEKLSRGRVRFDVVLDRERRDRRVHVETNVARHGRVRSSTGHYTTRIFVETQVRIGPVLRNVELSLVDREKMIYRMLLGRTALSGAFLIDPGRRALLKPKVRRKF